MSLPDVAHDLFHRLAVCGGRGIDTTGTIKLRCLLLAKQINAEAVVDARLMEMNFGSWESRLWADLPRLEVDAWLDDFLNFGPPAGESLRTVSARLFAFIQELDGDEAVIVVTHATILRLLLFWDVDFDPVRLFKEKLSFGEYRSFSLKGLQEVRKPLGLVF